MPMFSHDLDDTCLCIGRIEVGNGVGFSTIKGGSKRGPIFVTSPNAAGILGPEKLRLCTVLGDLGGLSNLGSFSRSS